MFIDYIGRFYHPIMELTEQFNSLQSSMVSAERVCNILDQFQEQNIEGTIQDIDEIKGEIEFKTYGLHMLMTIGC